MPLATHPSRRTVLRGMAASGLAASIAPSLARPADAAGARPPNVVFVSIDDLGWDELGCYGNTFNETPAHRPAGPRGHALHQRVRRRAALLADPRPPW